MILIKNNEDVSDKHTHRLVHARNVIVEKVFEHCADYDFLFCMDMDKVCHRPILLDTIIEILGRPNWDAVSFDRIFEPIGNVPPAEKEIEHYQQLEGSAMAA